ncbi:MAG: response regulator transcription factor [Campylobacteraceae bacterium]|nr:response regulator transcription factor [Campylobacteraceae bacterium]
MSDYKTRVLLVEDEEDAREILEFYLATIFDEVEIATNGEEGFDTCLAHQKQNKFFDVIITDIKMPKKDGMTMIEDITKVIPEQKYIIVSAHKDEEYLFRSIGLNVMGYFVKPLAVDNIMDMLKKVKEKILFSKKETLNKNIISLNKTYTYNVDKKTLFKGDISVKLSIKELSLVQVLISNLGTIVTKEMLKEKIWDDLNTSDATMRTIIKRVKDKVSDDDFIISRKGYGYLIE